MSRNAANLDFEPKKQPENYRIPSTCCEKNAFRTWQLSRTHKESNKASSEGGLLGKVIIMKPISMVDASESWTQPKG